ncbi:MAG TPA: TatD family hydrolase [Pusillimonas sp.]|uniref:TatD family hydrolase n=1 Tax=unclassified Pusillimonas TaxID=2640016 RepID=UPI00261DA0D0|nr:MULTISPECIES: TatD family hydrolase [unclassified Pusillimonas]HLU18662.1 TatD family hydrolase [Pusillimonas sp.]
MLIDTHCHLDAGEFQSDRDEVLKRAHDARVHAIVIPAIARSNFDRVRELAHSFAGGVYALGIHPICVPQASIDDLAVLESEIRASLSDPRFVGIGEIGLDFFLPELKTDAMRRRQEEFYSAQLDLAVQFDLPVILHVRRSHDILLKHLRRRPRIGGIGHAFNGSFQQAEQFIAQGFVLGMGGAMTFDRALQIRRLAQRLPLDALVLETDAPDIPPAWLESGSRNEPSSVAGVARVLAQIRGTTLDEVIVQTGANALRVLPRLATVLPRQAPFQAC